jgi:hypothetical protein
MKALYYWLNLLVCGLVLGSAACTVSFPDELPYTCEADADCGGKGYVCTSLPDARRYCCKPEPAELCNRLDDDCDGEIDELEATSCYTGPDNTRNIGACRAGKPTCGEGNIGCVGEVLPSQEVCNGKDDDCDGTVDEGFDFLTGRDNCGRCDQKCSATQDCIAGQCTGRREAACDNGADDDSDGPIDCVDPDCNALPCGPNCVCIGGKKGEAVCDNSVDDDADSTPQTTDKQDCADSDCDGKSCANADCGGRLCGVGCVCIGLKKGEGECGNGVDDDGDGVGTPPTLTDCKDPDCDAKECGVGCLCSGGNKTEVECGNNADDDGDSTQGTTDRVDCRDADCAGKECGVGCICSGSAKVEAACQDGLDNDGDNLVDCEDPQCDGQACVLGEPGAICKRKQCLENNCTDGLDNDKKNGTDCQDPGCEGLPHILARQVCTAANGPQESNCTNNQDDDADNRIDCRTQGQGSEPNCLDGSCGVGCKNNNTAGSACTAKIEIFCDDGISNDGDAQIDCADTADCEGKPCNTAPNVLGCTCTGGVKKETVCNDSKDNDYDNLVDCADTTDCPAATVCRKDDGTPGTCGSGRCN